jgi:hypothetical protein
MLVQATGAHELMANTLWEAHLRVEGKIIFPEPSSDYEKYYNVKCRNYCLKSRVCQ